MAGRGASVMEMEPTRPTRRSIGGGRKREIEKLLAAHGRITNPHTSQSSNQQNGGWGWGRVGGDLGREWWVFQLLVFFFALHPNPPPHRGLDCCLSFRWVLAFVVGVSSLLALPYAYYSSIAFCSSSPGIVVFLIVVNLQPPLAFFFGRLYFFSTLHFSTQAKVLERRPQSGDTRRQNSGDLSEGLLLERGEEWGEGEGEGEGDEEEEEEGEEGEGVSVGTFVWKEVVLLVVICVVWGAGYVWWLEQRVYGALEREVRVEENCNNLHIPYHPDNPLFPSLPGWFQAILVLLPITFPIRLAVPSLMTAAFVIEMEAAKKQLSHHLLLHAPSSIQTSKDVRRLINAHLRVLARRIETEALWKVQLLGVVVVPVVTILLLAYLAYSAEGAAFLELAWYFVPYAVLYVLLATRVLVAAAEYSKFAFDTRINILTLLQLTTDDTAALTPSASSGIAVEEGEGVLAAPPGLAAYQALMMNSEVGFHVLGYRVDNDSLTRIVSLAITVLTLALQAFLSKRYEQEGVR